MHKSSLFLLIAFFASCNGIYASANNNNAIVLTEEKIETVLKTLALEILLKHTNILDDLKIAKNTSQVDGAINQALHDYKNGQINRPIKKSLYPLKLLNSRDLENNKKPLKELLLSEKNPIEIATKNQYGRYNPNFNSLPNEDILPF